MHCEKAPCELVCPVEATQHDVEGLNVMTYNRCVGTRYCSNNCPYKVRRFNFLQYADTTTPVLMLMNNPEVTVRNRGVMEKCTYCIQRISRGRIESKKAARPRHRRRRCRGEHASEMLKRSSGRLEGIDTACAQACPTEAIVFGNMADQPTPGLQAEAEPTQLRPAGGPRHPAADDVPAAGLQPQPRGPEGRGPGRRRRRRRR